FPLPALMPLGLRIVHRKGLVILQHAGTQIVILFTGLAVDRDLAHRLARRIADLEHKILVRRPILAADRQGLLALFVPIRLRIDRAGHPLDRPFALHLYGRSGDWPDLSARTPIPPSISRSPRR